MIGAEDRVGISIELPTIRTSEVVDESFRNIVITLGSIATELDLAITLGRLDDKTLASVGIMTRRIIEQSESIRAYYLPSVPNEQPSKQTSSNDPEDNSSALSLSPPANPGINGSEPQTSKNLAPQPRRKPSTKSSSTDAPPGSSNDIEKLTLEPVSLDAYLDHLFRVPTDKVRKSNKSHIKVTGDHAIRIGNEDIALTPTETFALNLFLSHQRFNLTETMSKLGVTDPQLKAELKASINKIRDLLNTKLISPIHQEGNTRATTYRLFGRVVVADLREAKKEGPPDFSRTSPSRELDQTKPVVIKDKIPRANRLRPVRGVEQHLPLPKLRQPRQEYQAEAAPQDQDRSNIEQVEPALSETDIFKVDESLLSAFILEVGQIPENQVLLNVVEGIGQDKKPKKDSGQYEKPKPETWQSLAHCLGVDPDLFFPERGGSTREAKEVCRGCEVHDECLEYALENGEKYGIWGGLSERGRRRIRRTRNIARKKEKETKNQAGEPEIQSSIIKPEPEKEELIDFSHEPEVHIEDLFDTGYEPGPEELKVAEEIAEEIFRNTA